ncbi:hypothetical protein H2203_007302 [Taxawa tesnikishii (nom. ined.)]|nr:hypothetical protein H2203_007302 [Dothideales sp. JES 119]
MSLRDQLIAAQQPQSLPPPPQYHGPDPYPQAGPVSPHNHIDPNIGSPAGGQPYNMSGDSGVGDHSGERPTKRELSTTKRAAQNRAAQRAFRQRKEAYIVKLENQVKESEALAKDYEHLRQENYQLREYILTLQARSLESSTDLPPPPPTIRLGSPGNNAPPRNYQPSPRTNEELPRFEPSRSQTSPSRLSNDAHENAELPIGDINALQAAAAQAGELGNTSEEQHPEHHPDHPQYQYADYPSKRPRQDSLE